MKRPSRPRDTNVRAKLIVDLATGEAEENEPSSTNKGRRKAGQKGGKARAAALTKKQRSAIAREAAAARLEPAQMFMGELVFDTGRPRVVVV